VGALQGRPLSQPNGSRPQKPGAPEPWRDPDAEPYVRIEKVSKRFGAVVALDEVSLDIYRAELFALLGGSGSGKTTLLRALAGFGEPDSGRIMIDGQDMRGIPPYRRPVNMMFQSYALFPHMNVAQNIGFGLKQDGVARSEISDRVAQMLALVQLSGLEKRRPHELSGGQKQRVALARSLIKRPKLLLLDEPLGALDKNLREATQFELVGIQEQMGITFVIVTHDQEEAMTMATRIAVMERGGLAQVGTPAEVYEYPNSRFVAEFLGTANVFEGVVREAGATGAVVDSSELDMEFASDTDPPKPPGARVFVAVRPEKIDIRKARAGDAAGTNRLVGVVRDIAYYGDYFMYLVDVPGKGIVRASEPATHRLADVPITWADAVTLEWQPFASRVLPE
jgi:putrescine transport system ATP-binding protein